MRKLALLLALFAAPSCLPAQTVVSGTVLDPNGLAYSGGTLSLTQNGFLVPSGATLTSAGKFALNLTAGSGYTFTVQFAGIAPPLGTGPQTCTASGITVSGSTQTVSFTCPALAVSSGASGAAVAPNPGPNVFIVSSNCAGQANCFGTSSTGDTQQETTASWSPSNGNITIAGTGNSFCNGTTVACGAGKVTSIGMTAWGTTQCRTDTSSVIEVPIGTISSVTSPTVAVISTTPTTTRTANGCFTWGNYDDTAFANAETAADAAAICPSIIATAGMYLIQNQHFKTQPASCARIPSVQGVSNLGGFAFAFGGVGEGATRFVASPAFTANSTILGNASVSMQGMWLHDFSLDCGGDFTMSEMSSNNAAGLVNLAVYSKISNVALASCGANNSHTVGIAYQNPAHASYLTVDSFGGTCVRPNAVGAILYPDHSAFQDCQATYNSEVAGYTGTIVDLASGTLNSVGGNVFMAGVVSTSIINLLGTNSVLNLQPSDFVYDNGTTLLVVGINNTISSGTVDLNGPTIAVPNASTTSSAAVLNSGQVIAGGNAVIEGSTGGTTAAFVNNSGGTFYQQGTISFLGGSANFTNNGTVHGNSINGAPLVTGNVVLSACGSSTAGSFAGASSAGQFTITFAGTAVTTCTATITFPYSGGLFQTPLCQVTSNSGTNPFPANITIGTLNKTTLAFTENFTAAWTAGDTSVVNYSCNIP